MSLAKLLSTGGRTASLIPSDTGPGPDELLGFHQDEENPNIMSGFYGEVKSQDFINGSDLADAIGYKQGVVFNPDTEWLKFLLDGKVLFTPKQSIRNRVTWAELYRVGAVYGDDTYGLHPVGTPRLQDATVNIGVHTYRVRLFKGANVDPYDGTSGNDLPTTHGSEWNRLIYNVCSSTSSYPKNSQVGGQWASYSFSDMGFNMSSGKTAICQERNATNPNQILARGNGNVTRMDSVPHTNTGNPSGEYGWRPILELVSDEMLHPGNIQTAFVTPFTGFSDEFMFLGPTNTQYAFIQPQRKII